MKTKIEKCSKCGGDGWVDATAGRHYVSEFIHDRKQVVGKDGCSYCGGSGTEFFGVSGGYGSNSLKKGSGRVKATYDDDGYRSTEPSGCFPKGSLILTPTGERDISTLKKGDIVFSKNGDDDSVPSEIISVKKHEENRIWNLILSDHSVIRTTAIHSFLICGLWVKASSVCEGDIIYKIEGGCKKRLTVSRSTESSEYVVVYNIIVAGNYNFIVDGVVAQVLPMLNH